MLCSPVVVHPQTNVEPLAIISTKDFSVDSLTKLRIGWVVSMVKGVLQTRLPVARLGQIYLPSQRNHGVGGPNLILTFITIIACQIVRAAAICKCERSKSQPKEMTLQFKCCNLSRWEITIAACDASAQSHRPLSGPFLKCHFRPWQGYPKTAH